MLYSACCVLTAHGSSFPVLIIGRVLGGLSTAILFSAFESWLVGASQTVNLSPRGLDAVFTQQTVLNSILAVFSGLISQFLADYLRFGSKAKYREYVIRISLGFGKASKLYSIWQQWC